MSSLTVHTGDGFLTMAPTTLIRSTWRLILHVPGGASETFRPRVASIKHFWNGVAESLAQMAPIPCVSAAYLAMDLRLIGEIEAARCLDEDTMERRCRIFGADHPDTVNSAQNLATDLRELGLAEPARRLDADTLKRCRNVFGDNHPTTLTCASKLAIDLRVLGQVEEARQINKETLEKRRRLLGDNHMNTLRSASNLARDLFELGELKAAKELGAALPR